MSTAGAIAAYALCTGTFALTARCRARSAGDPLNFFPLLLFAVAAAGALSVHRAPLGLSAAVTLACVVVCAATDISSGYVYDAVTYVSAALICADAAATGNLLPSIAGAGSVPTVAGGLHLVTSGRGFGLGDVKLLAVVGAGVAAAPALVVLGAAFVGSAAVLSVALLLRRVSSTDRIAFAPFVAAATVGITLAQGVQS